MSADPLSRQFIEYAATKSEFISIISSVVNNIRKSKIAPLKGKIASQLQELLQSPLAPMEEPWFGPVFFKLFLLRPTWLGQIFSRPTGTKITIK